MLRSMCILISTKGAIEVLHSTQRAAVIGACGNETSQKTFDHSLHSVLSMCILISMKNAKEVKVHDMLETNEQNML